MSRRYVSIGMAVVFGLSALCWPSMTFPLSGDVNDDFRVDVLDIQAVAVSVLASIPASGMDVNGDGRVDILDFQALMAQTARTGSSPIPSHGVKYELVMYTAVTPLLFIPSERRSALLLEEQKNDQGKECFEHASLLLTRLPRIERYISGCSPNSPPEAA